MKNKGNTSIKKIVILLIVILIPLLAATFIGVYGYNRYQAGYFDNYMNEVEEDTNAKAHAFLKYSTYSYEKEPYYHEDVKVGDETVLTFEVYRSLVLVTKVDNVGKETITKEFQYHFAAYNINYSKLIEIKDPTGESKFEYDKIPSIYVKLEDNKDNDNVKVLTMGIPNDVLAIYDYNASPDKDSKGKDFNSKFLKWVTYTPEKDFSSNVSIKLLMSDDPENEADASYYSVITSLTKEDFVNNLTEAQAVGFEKGYESDYKKAGYLGYIFKDKIWWQALIAIVIVGFISLSFYVVWTTEEEQNKKKPIKK